jgi:hypothetical protein
MGLQQSRVQEKEEYTKDIQEIYDESYNEITDRLDIPIIEDCLCDNITYKEGNA